MLNRICKSITSTEIRKRNMKNWPSYSSCLILSDVKNMAISPCYFGTFCKQQQRNEQRIRTHAYTAVVFVAVAEFCF